MGATKEDYPQRTGNFIKKVENTSGMRRLEYYTPTIQQLTFEGIHIHNTKQ